MTLQDIPKVRNPFIRGWQGQPEDGDTRYISASTIAGRVPDFYRKRWHLGNMLMGLSRNRPLAQHVLELADKYPDLAADYALPFEYGPENEDGMTPAERGTDSHELIERWYREGVSLGGNDTASLIAHQMRTAMTHLELVPQLMEEFIYSPELLRGGRVDCIAELNGTWHVVDFKSMAKKPNRYYASKHYVQLGTYTQCTHLAAYDPVRTWGKGGRQYLINDTEAGWCVNLPELSNEVFVVIGWPDGYQVRRVTIDDTSVIEASARMYAFVEEEASKKNKLVAKGGYT